MRENGTPAVVTLACDKGYFLHIVLEDIERVVQTLDGVSIKMPTMDINIACLP